VKKIMLICLLALVLFMPAVFAEEAGVSATITFDKNAISVGEIITASYEITGLNSIDEMYGNWCVKTGENRWDQREGFESLERSGSCSFAPAYGSAVTLFLEVIDSNGEYFHFESEKIPVSGDASVEPEVTIALDKDSVAVGEIITAAYEIAERDDIYRVNGYWMIPMAYGEIEEYFETSALTGSSRFIPRYGDELCFILDVEMINGRSYHYESESIAVTGDTSVEPEMAVYFEQDSVAVGENITAYYEVSGSAEIAEVYLEWFVWTDERNGHSADENFTSNETNGTISFAPAFGKYVSVMLAAKDSSGRIYEYESEKIPVSGSNSSSGNEWPSEAPEVTIALDRETAAVGETITANYEIAGEGDYTEIEGDWRVAVTENTTRSGLNSFTTAQRSGSSSLKITYGVSVQFRLTVTDSRGARYTFNSEEIPVTGDEAKAPEVTIVFDKQSLSTGEVISADYEISGEGEYTRVEGGWVVQVDNTIKTSNERFATGFLSGSSRFWARYGQFVGLNISVIDAAGRRYWYESEMIPVSGYQSSPPVVTISYDRSSVEKGQLISASYDVQGDGAYRDVHVTWWNHEGSHDEQARCSTIDTTLRSGSSSYRPLTGDAVSMWINVKEETGLFYLIEGAKIPVTEEAAKMLILPADLKEIRAGAFANSNCTHVLCPDGLENIGEGAFADCSLLVRVEIPSPETEIADGAFAGCPDDMVIAAPEESNARRFAEENGYTFEAQ